MSKLRYHRPMASRHATRWLIVFFMASVFWAVMVSPGYATREKQPELHEYAAKAGFLYKFLFFADWPDTAIDSSNNIVVIGILGKDPFEGAFKPIEGGLVNGRKLVVRKFGKWASVESMRQCHIPCLSG